ncbi:MAG: hypothetical protein IJV41_11175 [Oscillospiraceae bacterium]|nr:hypothetical protein [Oscillospiraceae bacterium]
MWKKSVLLLAALALTVSAHLQPSCDFTVAGERIAVGCTPGAARRAEAAALAAAEEICPEAAVLPAVRRHVRLTLRNPGTDAARLSDALLRSTPGVTVSDGVYVDGTRLGSVRDGALFSARLRRYIVNTTPTWAVSGMLSQKLTVQTEYCRAGHEVTEDDMVLLVTGAAPVFYYDLSGNTATA